MKLSELKPFESAERHLKMAEMIKSEDGKK